MTTGKIKQPRIKFMKATCGFLYVLGNNLKNVRYLLFNIRVPKNETE